MPLAEKLLKEWNAYAMRCAFEVNLILSDNGPVLGKTLLAPFQNGRLVFDSQYLAVLLAAAYAKPVPPDFFRAVRRAEKCYRRGERTLALMHLALTGMPAVDLEKAQRLFAAEWAMARGVTPAQLLKLAGLRKDDDGDEENDEEDGGDDSSDPDSNDDSDGSDFDSRHPRWAAGTPGGIGGEFAPKDAGDATGALHDAIADAANTAVSMANRAGAETADDIKFPNEAIDSDLIGGLLLPIAVAFGGVEALGSDALASIAAHARAAINSAMVAVGNMGTVAAGKAQELYESMENAINNWLQDNDSTVQNENSNMGDSLQQLGTDPVTQQFRQGEADTANLLQNIVGPLSRSTINTVDWIDKNGATYDEIGGTLQSQYFDAASFNAALDRHLSKADYIAVNITKLTSEQQAIVEVHIPTCPQKTKHVSFYLNREVYGRHFNNQ